MVYITLHKSKPRASADRIGILDTTRWILTCGFSNKRAPFRLMHTAVWHCRWYRRSCSMSKGSMMIHSLARIERCIEGIFLSSSYSLIVFSIVWEIYVPWNLYPWMCEFVTTRLYPKLHGRPLFSQLPE